MSCFCYTKGAYERYGACRKKPSIKYQNKPIPPKRWILWKISVKYVFPPLRNPPLSKVFRSVKVRLSIPTTRCATTVPPRNRTSAAFCEPCRGRKGGINPAALATWPSAKATWWRCARPTFRRPWNKGWCQLVCEFLIGWWFWKGWKSFFIVFLCLKVITLFFQLLAPYPKKGAKQPTR